MNLDPGAISLIQNNFLQHINGAFTLIAHYALNLLYIFVVLEIAITGLAWALQQEMGWGKVFFKIIKIGLIFFLIQNYGTLMDVVIRSFAQLGGIVANTSGLSQFIFNPAHIWQFGYNAGLLLLETAAQSTSIGLSLIQIVLGMGILFVFGLLGIQIVLQIVGFYLLSFISLILLPLGVFNPSANMFEQAVQNVLKAGVRVMVLIMVIGIAVTVWAGFDLLHVATATGQNINQPLGLFFTALLFLYLAIKLPKMAAQAVGQFRISSPGVATQTVVQSPPAMGAGAVAQERETSSMQAAASVAPAMAQTAQSFPATQVAAAVPTAAAPQVASVSGASPQGPIGRAEGKADTLSSAYAVQKSISEATAKKLKKTFMEMLEEKQLQESVDKR